jgi:5'-nucleotidase
MANIYVPNEIRIVGEFPRNHIITHYGTKIGLFGLSEFEWLGLLNQYTIQDKLFYVDFIETAQEISQSLKSQGCDYTIALTHLRVPNDRTLEQNCQDEIDLILGGHDHSSLCQRIDKVT